MGSGGHFPGSYHPLPSLWILPLWPLFLLLLWCLVHSAHFHHISSGQHAGVKEEGIGLGQSMGMSLHPGQPLLWFSKSRVWQAMSGPGLIAINNTP